MKNSQRLLVALLGLSFCLPAVAASFAERKLNRAFKNNTPLCWKMTAADETDYLNIWVMQKRGPRFMWVGEKHSTRKRPNDWRDIDYFAGGSGTIVRNKVMMQAHDGVFGLPKGIDTASTVFLLATKTLNGSMRQIDRSMDETSKSADYDTATLTRINCI